MSFRKRSVPLTNTARQPATPNSPSVPPSEVPSSATTPAPVPVKQPPALGVRLSPSFSVHTTSTGLSSLDTLLRLGAGLALGTSLVIEEDGTTDYAGALLRCFVSEGVVQGHKVFVLAHEAWGATLPGLAVEKESSKKVMKEKSVQDERMKIAWRYERMGLHGDGRDRSGPVNSSSLHQTPFCHTFDLSVRLARPSSSPSISYLPPKPDPKQPYPDLTPIQKYLAQSPSHHPVRLAIPSLLSPIFYPTPSDPHVFIRFIDSLRELQIKHSNLVIMISWPLALYPTDHILTWWLERLTDGAIRLEPFPHSFSMDAVILQDSEVNPSAAKKDEDKMQGLLRVRQLPILTDRGMGTGTEEDMAWSLGRKRFVIRPFNLPPLEIEKPEENPEVAKKTKDLEF